MKIYKNEATRITKFYFPFCTILYAVIFILIYIIWDENGIEKILFCLMFFLLPFLIFSLFILLQKDAFMTTYYDDNKFVQKFFWKKKTLNYSDIKEIYVVNNYVYFTTKPWKLDLKKNFLIKFKVYRILKKETIVIIDKPDANFLKFIAKYNIEPIVLYDRGGYADVIIDKYFYET